MLRVETLRSKPIAYSTSVPKSLTPAMRRAKCRFVTSFIIKLIIRL